MFYRTTAGSKLSRLRVCDLLGFNGPVGCKPRWACTWNTTQIGDLAVARLFEGRQGESLAVNGRVVPGGEVDPYGGVSDTDTES